MRYLCVFLPFLVFFFLPPFFAGSQVVSESSLLDRKIDSLVSIRRVNDRCVLVSFGSDAVTAIQTHTGIVVIDAGISTGLTTKYRKIIEQEFNRKDFSHVIISHGHHDHCRGSSVFPEATMIGHARAGEEITDMWKDPDRVALNLQKLSEDLERQMHDTSTDPADRAEFFTQMIRCRYAAADARNHIPARQPDVTFADSLSLDLGDASLDMYYFGICHSRSDILIHIPEMKLLFTGDLFSKYGRPALDEDLTGERIRWKLAKQWIEKRKDKIQTIITGHGQLLVLDDLLSFLEIVE